MKYKPEQQNNTDHALTSAVFSAFRTINPSYETTLAWYKEKNHTHLNVSPVLDNVRSKYYIPLFGSAFASAFALIMILTSQNSFTPSSGVAFEATASQGSTNIANLKTFSSVSAKSEPIGAGKVHVLAKIDAQSKSTSRTQADESFTASLNTETSLRDLFE